MACFQIHYYRDEFSFAAKIHLINGNVMYRCQWNRLIFILQIWLVYVFYGVPTQTCQLGSICDGHYPAQVNYKPLKRTGVMFLRVGKVKIRLSYRTAVFAEQSRNAYWQINMFFADKQSFKRPPLMAILNHMPRSTDRTEYSAGVQWTSKDRLAIKKSVLRYCTERMPKVWYSRLLDIALSPIGGLFFSTYHKAMSFFCNPNYSFAGRAISSCCE